jgi:hypothetical protein
MLEKLTLMLVGTKESMAKNLGKDGARSVSC